MIAVEQCHLREQCGRLWEMLEPVIGNPQVRFCELCQSAVHLAADADQQAAFAREGKCYAFARECKARSNPCASIPEN